MDRRDEVFQVVDDSETVDEAIRGVGQLLGIGAVGSRAVIDLHVRRFTGGQRRAVNPETRMGRTVYEGMGSGWPGLLNRIDGELAGQPDGRQ